MLRAPPAPGLVRLSETFSAGGSAFQGTAVCASPQGWGTVSVPDMRAHVCIMCPTSDHPALPPTHIYCLSPPELASGHGGVAYRWGLKNANLLEKGVCMMVIWTNIVQPGQLQNRRGRRMASCGLQAERWVCILAIASKEVDSLSCRTTTTITSSIVMISAAKDLFLVPLSSQQAFRLSRTCPVPGSIRTRPQATLSWTWTKLPANGLRHRTRAHQRAW